MEKFISEDLGPIQVKRMKQALSEMSWESKARIELTNRLNEKGEIEDNSSKLIDVFGQTSEFYAQEYQRLFNLFNGKINKENLKEFLEEAGKSLKTIMDNPRIEDKRKTREELEEKDRELKARMEEERKKREEFERQSVEIPKDKMGICLDLCFDDSDIMTDYFSPHRSLEKRLLAIVKRQPQKEALARRIASQIPDLKDFEWTWHTENYSMGHGNYLSATKVHETRKHDAYDGRKEVACFYEITFNGWDREIPHHQYLGDLTKSTPKGVKGDGIEVRENKEKNGVEIIFAAKPNDEVLTSLKANGWRWSRFNGLWYNKLTPENLDFAKNLTC